jgi:hypothetical protein
MIADMSNVKEMQFMMCQMYKCVHTFDAQSGKLMFAVWDKCFASAKPENTFQQIRVCRRERDNILQLP